MNARDLSRDFRLLTSPIRMLPSFVLPGESKCGTTSLYRYIVSHPNVFPCVRKEPKNFIQYPQSLLQCRSYYPTLIAKWGANLIRRGCVISGEATAEYFSHPDAAKTIRSLLPDLKIIVLLRNPVHRAYSDYCMFRSRNKVSMSFEEIVDKSLRWLKDDSIVDLVQPALRTEDFYLRFIARGMYADSLSRWQTEFPGEQVLILKSEDLFDRTRVTMNQVFEFLELDPVSVGESDIKRKGDYDHGMGSAMQRRLRSFYAPYNAQLYRLIDRDMEWDEELAEMSNARVSKV